MANYAVTDWTTQGTREEVLAAIETKLETIDTGKTIRLLETHHNAGKIWYAVMIYDA